MQDRMLIVNPLENDIIMKLTGACGRVKFDVLYTDMTTDEQSIGKIVNGRYDILVFQDMRSKFKSDCILDMINFGYLAGRSILVVADSMSFIRRLESRLGSTIKELKNVKYVLTPIEQLNLDRRLGQLSQSVDRKTTQQIFNEIQLDIVKVKNSKRSGLTRFVECFI